MNGWVSRLLYDLTAEANLECTCIYTKTINVLIDATFIGNAYFGPGSGFINMEQVACEGNESFLTNCSHSTPRTCDHFSDVSVVCLTIPGRNI